MAPRRKILAALITVAAIVALSVSSYLTWTIWQTQSVAGCSIDAGFDCDDVLASRWSKFFGQPVSLFGALTYLAILGLAWPAARRRDGVAMPALFTLGLMAAGAGLWFTGLQAIELQSYCLYCLTVHICGLLIAGLTLMLFLDRTVKSDMQQMQSLLGVETVDATAEVLELAEPVSMARLLTTLAASALGLTVLMGGQMLIEPPEENVLEEVEFDITSDTSTNLEETIKSTGSARTTPAPTNKALSNNKQTTTENVASKNTADDTATTLEPSSLAENASDSSTDAAETDFILDNDGEFEEFGNLPGEAMTVDSLVGSSFDSETGLLQFPALPEAVDPEAMPILGSTQAKHIAIELIDYTCDHCRKLHPHIDAAIKHYDGQFAVLVHHAPLSKKCNPYVTQDYPGKKNSCAYAQLAIGVWRFAPKKFPAYHNWLMEGEHPPNLSKATQRAWKLVGTEISTDKKRKAEISRILSKQCTNLKRLNSGLPILLLQNGALRGVPKQSEDLFKFLENKLDLNAQGSN